MTISRNIQTGLRLAFVGAVLLGMAIAAVVHAARAWLGG